MPTFFETAQQFRSWLKTHHKTRRQLQVGFRVRANGHACIGLEEAKTEAMAVGWFAARRIRIDRLTYAVAFSPRPARAVWPSEDIFLAERLIREGKMADSGKKSFESRAAPRKATKSSDLADTSALSATMLSEFRRHPAAWAHFQHLPPSLQEKWTLWVMEAKQEETRARRFAKLMLDMSRAR